MTELPPAKWHDDAHPPTEPGIYYVENCNIFGDPSPGLMYWEDGKPWQPPPIPTKYFGPIRGAMQPWPMVPIEEKK